MASASATRRPGRPRLPHAAVHQAARFQVGRIGVDVDTGGVRPGFVLLLLRFEEGDILKERRPDLIVHTLGNTGHGEIGAMRLRPELVQAGLGLGRDGVEVAVRHAVAAVALGRADAGGSAADVENHRRRRDEAIVCSGRCCRKAPSLAASRGGRSIIQRVVRTPRGVRSVGCPAFRQPHLAERKWGERRANCESLSRLSSALAFAPDMESKDGLAASPGDRASGNREYGGSMGPLAIQSREPVRSTGVAGTRAPGGTVLWPGTATHVPEPSNWSP